MYKKFAVFDIEVSNWKNIVVIGFFDGLKKYYFKTARDFLRFLFDNYKNYTLYAHNGGRFDFIFLIDEILEYSFKVDFILIQSGIYKIIIKDLNIVFQDTYFQFKNSLENIAFNYELDYTKYKIDYDNIERIGSNELLEYLDNDLNILYNLIIKFNDFTGKYPSTISNFAFQSYKETYGLSIVKPYLNSFFRDNFYFGGRTEVFKRYGKSINVYDINSSYPYAMIGDFPVGEFYKTRKREKGKIGFYKIKLISDYFEYIPKIPVRFKSGLFFPIIEKGTELYVNEFEVDNLEESNTKFDIIEVYYSMKQSNIFEHYVNELYDKKVKATGIEKELIKLKLNSLYGKFAQKEIREVISNYYLDSDIEVSVYDIKRKLFKRKIKGIINNNIYSIACVITSKARNNLNKYIDKNTYYVDTDSIFTDNEYVVSNKLGCLKNEYKGIEFFGILPKVYGLFRNGYAEKIVIKGFSKKEYDRENFLEYLKNGDKFIRETVKRFVSFKKYLKKSEINMTVDEREIKSDFTKRILIDSVNTIPYTYNQLKGIYYEKEKK